MRKILVIKTSSLGDVVHNFPVISDIKANFPDVAIDWMVEEAYQSLVQLHPGVRRAIPVSIRRWRRDLLQFDTWSELGKLRNFFRNSPYDQIIDTQGLIKSALLAYGAHGLSHGFDSRSAREPLAARFYDVRHNVAREMHAVMRNRKLASQALGYTLAEFIDYGLTVRSDEAFVSLNNSVVFLHSTSKQEKHWRESHWVTLGEKVEASGLRVILPWGNHSERLRSERIATSLGNPLIPESLGIDRLASLLGNCIAVVGVDTGLTHLAAALGTPVAAIFCATDPKRTGTFGASRSHNLGGPGRMPEVSEVIHVLRREGVL